MEIAEIYDEAQEVVTQFITKYPKGVVVIRGSTATGKTDLSVRLAEHFPIEIIGADSRQLFRGMDIGTGKIDKKMRKKIPHHQIDIIDPDQHYTAGQWKSDTETIIATIQKKGHIPVIVGGTGLYIDTIYKNFSMPEVPADYVLREELYAAEEQEPGSLWKKLYIIDPEEAQKHHAHSVRYIIRALEIYQQSGKTKTESFIQQAPKRPILMLGLRREKDDTNRRINKRIHEMFDEGLIEEVQGLLDKCYTADLQSMQGIGYKEVVQLLQREIDKETCEELIKRNTHHLAKKQRTWFRRYILDSKIGKENVVYKTFFL